MKGGIQLCFNPFLAVVVYSLDWKIKFFKVDLNIAGRSFNVIWNKARFPPSKADTAPRKVAIAVHAACPDAPIGLLVRSGALKDQVLGQNTSTFWLETVRASLVAPPNRSNRGRFDAGLASAIRQVSEASHY